MDKERVSTLLYWRNYKSDTLNKRNLVVWRYTGWVCILQISSWTEKTLITEPAGSHNTPPLSDLHAVLYADTVSGHLGETRSSDVLDPLHVRSLRRTGLGQRYCPHYIPGYLYSFPVICVSSPHKRVWEETVRVLRVTLSLPYRHLLWAYPADQTRVALPWHIPLLFLRSDDAVLFQRIYWLL